MKQTKTIPFDWEEYNNNRDKYKVVTRDGDEVTQLTKFERLPLLPVLMGVEGGVTLIRWTESGHFRLNKSYSDFDLQLQYEEEVRELWIIIIQKEDGTRRVVNAHYLTKERAIDASNVIEGKLIATINLYDL